MRLVSLTCLEVVRDPHMLRRSWDRVPPARDREGIDFRRVHLELVALDLCLFALRSQENAQFPVTLPSVSERGSARIVVRLLLGRRLEPLLCLSLDQAEERFGCLAGSENFDEVSQGDIELTRVF